MCEFPEPLALWRQSWQRAQAHLAQAEAWPQAAVLGLHLRVGLWLSGQAARELGFGPWAQAARHPATVEQVFDWLPQVAQTPPLPGWPAAEVLWRRIVPARVLHPGPKLQAQVYLLLQLLHRAGAPLDGLSWLRWHLLLEQALATWLGADEAAAREEAVLPWLFAPGGLCRWDATPQRLLPPGAPRCLHPLAETTSWEQRLAAAWKRWDQGDRGGLVVRELLAAWGDAQRRDRSTWREEQVQLFDRVHRLLDGTRPWELLPRASAVLDTESWPQRCQELQQKLLQARQPAEEVSRRAWQLFRALDDAELVLYAGRRLARINAQLAQRIEQQRLQVLQRPGVLLAAWPWVQQFGKELQGELRRRDYELAQTTLKFQALADHLAAACWRMRFAEPAETSVAAAGKPPADSRRSSPH